MRAAIVLVALTLTACATLGPAPPLVCRAGLKPATVSELYFGRNIGAREGVGDADWRDFVTREIAPRFPDGYTVSDAQGHWHGADGRIVQEPSKRVLIVLSGRGDEEAKLAAIRAAYKTRFHQDSVLEVETQVCAGF